MISERLVAGKALPRTQERAGTTAALRSTSLESTAVSSARMLNVLQDPGEPLGSRMRTVLERRFGRDLSRVRVHADERAADSASRLAARAYTIGHHIMLGPGGPDPAVLAHEVVHVLQQSQAPSAGSEVPGRLPLDPRLDAEKQAEKAAVTGELGEAAVATPVSVQRQARPGVPFPMAGSAGALPTFGNDDRENLADIMGAVEGIRPVGDGNFETRFKGQVVRMNASQRDNLVGQATRAMRSSLRRVRDKAENTRAAFEYQRKVNEDSRVISFIVTSIAGIRGVPTQGLGAAWNAEQLVTAAEGALGTGRLVSAAKSLSDAEVQASAAARSWHEYHEGIISSAERSVAFLEHTRDASFITLGVLAIIATGGAAAGAAGAAGGATTTAFGLTIGTSTRRHGHFRWGTACCQRWSGWNALVPRRAGGLVEGRRRCCCLRLAFKTVVRSPTSCSSRLSGIQPFVVWVRCTLGASPAAFSFTRDRRLSLLRLTGTYAKLSGKPVTWGTFLDELVARLLDPRGASIAVLMGAVAGRSGRREVHWRWARAP